VLLQQFEECTCLIDRILASTSGSSEYAVYVKALIQRQRGEHGSMPGMAADASISRLGCIDCHSVVNMYPMSHQHQLYSALLSSMRYMHCASSHVLHDVLHAHGTPRPAWLSVSQAACLPAGNIQESLKLFQQATALNPHNAANLKQVRPRADLIVNASIKH
jgi:hypothetical protein